MPSESTNFVEIQHTINNSPGLSDSEFINLIKKHSECSKLEQVEINYNIDKVNIIHKSIQENNKKEITSDSVTITMTTCKRIDLFEITVNSFIEYCIDINTVYEWLVVDDNSSESDRKRMQAMYPFITFIFKDEQQKGHSKSMNILIKKIKTPLVFHLEDDWKFFIHDNYITKCKRVINQNKKYGQCLLNRGYSEDLATAGRILGGYPRFINEYPSIKYFIHEHISGPSLDEHHSINAKLGFSSCFYWPHYSLRVGLSKKEMYEDVGEFDNNAEHFEMEYANRYVEKEYLTTYLDSTYCIHIGRRTYESKTEKPNAYSLNNEKQFGLTHEIPHQNANQNTIPERPKTNLNICCNVINLERRPDRLEKFKNINQKELPNFTVIKAIDGQKLKPSQKIQKLFKHNDFNYRRGIVGCALSHIKEWYDCIMNPNIHGKIIIEDDAELTTNFLEKTVHCIGSTPDADIIFLSHHPYPQYDNKENYDRNVKPVTELWNREKCIRESMGGTTAYYITKKGCINMINKLNKHGITNAIDWELFKTATDGGLKTATDQEENSNKIYYCKPFLAFAECTQKGNVDSDIQFDKEGLGFKSITEILEDQIKYWGQTGIKNIRKLNNTELLLEDPNSLLVYRENLTELIGILKTVSIFPNNENIKNELLLYPLYWYEIEGLLFTVPEPMVTEKMLNDKTFFHSYISEKCSF